MIRKQRSSLPDHVRITFELPSCVWADRVFVTGEFNDWNQHALRMMQERDGVWRAEIDLPEGSCYQFRYIVDGRWQTDHHADGFSDNGYGTQNSIVHATTTRPAFTELSGALGPMNSTPKATYAQHRYESAVAAHRLPRGTATPQRRRSRTPQRSLPSGGQVRIVEG